MEMIRLLRGPDGRRPRLTLSGLGSGDTSHMPGRLVALALTACCAAGCGLLTDGVVPSAAAQCQAAAQKQGPDFTVSGAFATTVERARSIQGPGGDPPLWPDVDGGDPAVVCYLDGFVPKAPPPVDGQAARSFDRAIVAIVNGEQTPLVAGYQDRLPVRPP